MPLNLSKKLGQLLFVGFQGFTLSKETRKFLEIVQPGGIIFFECNIKDKRQVKNLIQEINACLEIKPFIAVDQEGGSVERLRNICTSLPSVWGLAKLGLKELLAAQEIIAHELLELGFNMVLGPVLDINSNPKNPIIGTRSISGDPKIVSKYGSSIVNLFLKNKIIPVIKHFPGHGDLDIDSHLSLPVLSKSKDELNNFELLPFKKAIQNKASIVMVGHIQLPEVEKDQIKPASLSNKVIEGLLRKELKFKGLVITDELNMKGVTKNYKLEEASHEAILAGADLLLFNDKEQKTLKAFEYIKGRLTKNKNLLKRTNESYKRITTLKKKYFKNSKGISVIGRAHAPRNDVVCHHLASKVVHWIKKNLFFHPLSKKDDLEIIYPITPKLRTGDFKNIFNRLKIKKYSLLNYDLNPNFESVPKIIRKLKKNTRKVLITYDAISKSGQKNLIKLLLEKNPSLVVIGAGLEYDIGAIPQIQNYVAAYAPNYISLLVAFEKLLRED